MCECHKYFFKKFLLYIFLAICALRFGFTFCMQENYINYFKDLYKNMKIEQLNDVPECNSIKIFFNKKHLRKNKKLLENIAQEISDTIRVNKIKNNNNSHENYSQINLANTNDMILSKTIEETINEIAKQDNPELCLFHDCPCKSYKERSEFEESISSNNLESINYVGIASGDMLSDLRILTNIFTKKINTIHLIDKKYNNLIQKLKENAQKEAKKSNNFLLAYFFKNKLIKPDNLTPSLFIEIIKFAQFIKLLSEFQASPIDLIIHSDIYSYTQACKKQKKLLANLATIIDYDGEKKPEYQTPARCSLKNDNIDYLLENHDYLVAKSINFKNYYSLIEKIKRDGLSKNGKLYELK